MDHGFLTMRWSQSNRVPRVALVVSASLAWLTACGGAEDRPQPGRCSGTLAYGTGPVEAARRRPPVTRGRVLHVQASGSDAADCSAAAPCREIARAAPILRAGDTLVIGDGDYARFTLSGASGRADAPITLFASGAGARVRGTQGCEPRDRSCASAILIERSQHVVLDGLGASGAVRAGLAVEFGQRITVRNGVFTDNGKWGIFSSFVDDLIIEHNQTAASRTQHGIYASNSGDRTVIRKNLVHDNHGCGIQINADWSIQDPDDLYPGEVDGITSGARIEDNVIFRNGRGGGAAINLDGVQDSVIRNNLLHDNLASGIVNYGDQDGIADMSPDDGDGRQGPRGMVVVHNTVVQPAEARAALLFRYSAGPNLVRNNILAHAGEDGPSILLGGPEDESNLDSDHNILSRVLVEANAPAGSSTSKATTGRLLELPAWKALGKDRHSLSARVSDVFIAPGCNFALSRTSPARNRGAIIEYPAPDLSGRPRPRGAAPDLGALESP
jgi:Right handed beta helix region